MTPLIGVHIAVILIFILKRFKNGFNDRKDQGKKKRTAKIQMDWRLLLSIMVFAFKRHSVYSRVAILVYFDKGLI